MQDALLESRWGRPLVGGAAAGAGLAGAYAATGYTPAFLVSPIERFLARTMPGAVITFAIENLGNLGQQLNLLQYLQPLPQTHFQLLLHLQLLHRRPVCCRLL